MKRTIGYLFLCVLSFLLLTGCSSLPQPKIAAPDFIQRTKTVKKIGIILAGSYVFEIGVGNTKELNIEWSNQAANNLVKVSADQLNLAGYKTTLLKTDNNTKVVVNAFNSIQRDNLTRYVYSARKIDAPMSSALTELLNKEGLDALVLIRGIDHVSSSGRQALKVAAAILGTGVSSGVAHIELAMVDRSPAFIYYSHKSEDGKDLRTESGTTDLFNEIVVDLKDLRGI